MTGPEEAGDEMACRGPTLRWGTEASSEPAKRHAGFGGQTSLGQVTESCATHTVHGLKAHGRTQSTPSVNSKLTELSSKMQMTLTLSCGGFVE